MAYATPSGLRHDLRTVGLISAGHFLSHFYIFTLPPLFPILKSELSVSYGALGLIVTVFNIASGVSQIPMGFMVDRFGARRLLIMGICLEALAFIAIGLTGFFWGILVCIAIAGLANSVYHPADYSILSASIGESHMGRAFSVHTCSGYAGNAVAPVIAVALATLFNWQVAVIFAGLLGLAIAALILLGGQDLADGREPPAAEPRAAQSSDGNRSGIALILSMPIFMCFLFYVTLAMSASGLSNFSVSAFNEIYQGIYESPISVATAALTLYLLGNAAGILVGGFIADRTRYHERVAMAGIAVTAMLMVFLGQVILPAAALLTVLTIGGLLYGMIMPSRDMLVRKATPPGSMGKVFGFVSSGLNLGGAVSPVIFGALLDYGAPTWLFSVTAAFMLLSMVTVYLTARAGRV